MDIAKFWDCALCVQQGWVATAQYNHYDQLEGFSPPPTPTSPGLPSPLIGTIQGFQISMHMNMQHSKQQFFYLQLNCLVSVLRCWIHLKLVVVMELELALHPMKRLHVCVCVCVCVSGLENCDRNVLYMYYTCTCCTMM